MSDPFFPEDVREAADKLGGDWLKGADFEDSPTLQLVRPMERIKSNNPKYGAQEEDFLVKGEILEVGETFRYIFKTPQGDEKKFDSKSAPFFLGFKQAHELGVGDWIKITRTGKTDKTRYTVEKVETPVLPSKSDSDTEGYPEEDIDTSNIAF